MRQYSMHDTPAAATVSNDEESLDFRSYVVTLLGDY